jgi:lysophospholipid acyltransferase (LPLAT)-like uncharacterized protein
MKLRNPRLIRLVAFLGAVVIRLWMKTIRVEIDDGGQHLAPDDPAIEGRYIYAVWHEAILFLTRWKMRAKIQVMISQHADGELIAQVCKYLGVDVVRGSTTRGGAAALYGMIQQGEDSHMLVTPDGPRGPRRHAQAGAVYLAARTGLPVVPVGVGFRNAWRAKSWDRFAVPKPFSSIVAVAMPILHVPAEVDRDTITEYRLELEKRMLAATAAAETWAEGRKPQTMAPSFRATIGQMAST